MAAPLFMIIDQLEAYGVDNIALFDEDTTAQIIIPKFLMIMMKHARILLLLIYIKILRNF